MVESSCDIICLQETKKDHFDLNFIKYFCPPIFDSFLFVPSVSASGGIITIWKSSVLDGVLAYQNEFAISVHFTSQFTDDDWLLTNVYGPSTYDRKREFVMWLKQIQMPAHVDWLLVGDFNLMTSPANRNRPGGDMAEMFLFNEAISALRLVELPLHGKKYTWTNKQQPPLLERLDWFFTSNSWTLSYPDFVVWTLTMEVSDHVPCVVKVSTSVPKGSRFRFENYLMEHEDFMSVVQHGWGLPTTQTDAAKKITEKFKNLRRVLKAWKSQLTT